MKAYIYFDNKKCYKQDKYSREYSGEGRYILVDETGKELNYHYCSSRGFANSDLIITSESERILEKNNIDTIYSNGRIVYERGLSYD